MIEDELLKWRFRRGSQEALARIYEKYVHLLLSVAMGLLNDPYEAEDVGQDVFASFARDAARFALRGSLKAYLARCLVNRVRDRVRSKRARQRRADGWAAVPSEVDGSYHRMRRMVLDSPSPTENTQKTRMMSIRRIVMDKPVVKPAIAAVVIAAVTLGLFEFLGPDSRSGVVRAQVAERTDAGGGFIYRTRTIQSQAGMDQPIEWSTMTYNCPRYGMRIERIDEDTMDSYVSYEEGTQVTLFHNMKRYTRRTLPPRPDNAEVEPSAGARARNMVRQFTSGDYKELGGRTINGVEAEGIESQHVRGGGGNFPIDSETAQLWVSVDTGYPVLLEIHVVGNNDTVQIEMVMDQFQWDVEFDPSEFKTVIPPDYELLEIGPRGGMRGWSDFGVVWAQEKKAEEKKKKEEETGLGFMYRQRQTQTQPGIAKPMRFMAMIRESPQYGHRMDRYERGKVTGSTYVNYVDGTTISSFHKRKMYIRRDWPKGSPVPKQTADPRVQIKTALAGEHKKLGRRTIGGVETEGIEARNVRGSKANFKIDSVVRQFWSSVETGYPVLVEQTVVGNDDALRIKTICDQFRWNVRFDPNEFKTRVPPDYQLLDMQQVRQGQGGFGAGAYGNRR